jgi:glycosyltransferase involved in cell wall biosynthesis
MKIAVYTIAKNEEQFVERWAESCKEADYRFILDTGSTDSTVSLATSLGIEVSVATISPWRFDDARNTSLALLPADVDYCIALDMDEILIEGWREHLEAINPETTRPRYKYTWSWVDGKPGLQYGGDKIHSRKGYRWKHPVHEVITADRIEEVQEWIPLEIHHHPDNTKPRSQYLPLLELSTKENPWDDRNAFYYGRELFLYGQHKQAADELKRHLSLPTALWAPERAASMRYIAKCEPENAREWLEKAIAEAPGRREALVELALYFYIHEDWENCHYTAMDALHIEDKPLDYLCEEFAWNELPYDLGAISAHHLGFAEVAKSLGEKAVALNPNDERLANNLVFYQAQ